MINSKCYKSYTKYWICILFSISNSDKKFPFNINSFLSDFQCYYHQKYYHSLFSMVLSVIRQLYDFYNYHCSFSQAGRHLLWSSPSLSSALLHCCYCYIMYRNLWKCSYQIKFLAKQLRSLWNYSFDTSCNSIYFYKININEYKQTFNCHLFVVS